MNERKMEGKEKSKTSKRLLAIGALLASLLGGQAFAISLGQGFPQAVRQSVIVNEKLQTAGQDVFLLINNLETASGGFDKYLEKTDWQLFLETQASIRFSLNLNAKSPQVRYFLQTDPVGYKDSLNLYQSFGNNPINFTDPMGTEIVIAEFGKHDVFKTQRIKTGKWWLDYTAIGVFNELRNTAALAVNMGTNLLGIGGEAHDNVVAGADRLSAKLGLGNEGDLTNFVQFAEIFSMTNSSQISSAWSQLKGYMAPAIENAGINAANSYSNSQLASEAGQIGKANPLDIVPSKYRNRVIEAFEGEPELITLKEDLIVYRRWGGKSDEIGSPWFAKNAYIKPGNAKRFLALPEKNTAKELTMFRIPAGTKILSGKTASQAMNPVFGKYATGGGIQIYLPDPSIAIKIN